MKTWTLHIGANIKKDGVFFRVWAPKSSSISVCLVEGKKKYHMKKEEKGYYSAFVKGIKAGSRYFYLIDNDKLRPDPVSRFQSEGVDGSSMVVNPYEFNWDDQSWKGISFEHLIIYELHTGTFTKEGTFEAIIPYLNYLKNDLGINAIELMPVGQFSGERNWGYDGTYIYAPQNSYGGPEGLKKLINSCHNLGIAVILDVVYNHLGPEGNYLSDYGYYFTDKYKTPWGPAFNYDDAYSDEVREFIINNAIYWVKEYHIDGLRLDAIHGIFDFSPKHIISDIRKAVHNEGKKLDRKVFIIAESDLNDVRIVNPPYKGGYGVDAQWNDDFHHSLHSLLTEEKTGYYQDFGHFNQLVKALKEGFAYTGQYSGYRKKRHGSSSKHLPPSRFVAFSQNHDQIGNRMMGERLSSIIGTDSLKLAAAIVVLSPFIPLIFMGEEYAENSPFQYFVSHSDPELIDNVRKGRTDEFASFNWQEEIPDPQDAKTFLRSKIDLNLRYSGKHKEIFKVYRTLIKLRKDNPSLGVFERKNIKVESFDRVLIIKRKLNREQTACIFNFHNKPASIEVKLDTGTWINLFSITESLENTIVSNGSVVIELDKYAFLILKKLK